MASFTYPAMPTLKYSLWTKYYCTCNYTTTTTTTTTNNNNNNNYYHPIPILVWGSNYRDNDGILKETVIQARVLHRWSTLQLVPHQGWDFPSLEPPGGPCQIQDGISEMSRLSRKLRKLSRNEQTKQVAIYKKKRHETPEHVKRFACHLWFADSIDSLLLGIGKCKASFQITRPKNVHGQLVWRHPHTDLSNLKNSYYLVHSNAAWSVYYKYINYILYIWTALEAI